MTDGRSVFDFAMPIERRQPWPSQKWQRYDSDVLPLWVADMDFASPPAVIEALHRRVEHGVFGYGRIPDSLRDSLCGWSDTHYGWGIEPRSQVWLPGVVPALHLACQALTEPGDGIMTVTPIYPPFLKVACQHGRQSQTVPLSAPSTSGDEWSLDAEAIEATIRPETRMLLWCHPHNPTGHIWRDWELSVVAELAERHDLIIVSDELHCDLLLDEGACHQPLAYRFPELAERIVTLWAPSKTFNLAGLTCACAVIPDRALRQRFMAGTRGLRPEPNIMGLVAAEAAYLHGEPWRQALLETLRSNRSQLSSAVTNWSGAELHWPEATYLAWLDLRNTGLGESPTIPLLNSGRVALSDGADFGWPGFARLNFGTTPDRLAEALWRLGQMMSASSQ
ncbi:cystathione beta-lyase [Aidingimonas halophila]|uniref:cysteine-S-conjugate beta-lyase n=2 Tax=Aidingimonas halophila TaxID=574349 RepID=A0A1H2VXH9_9GAMM|nr:aspartate aminotransferase [Aidingimonas halophila]SDW72559.1 cystathione beta-lyase [Aidingimonas halophila]